MMEEAMTHIKFDKITKGSSKNPKDLQSLFFQLIELHQAELTDIIESLLWCILQQWYPKIDLPPDLKTALKHSLKLSF